MIFLNNKLCVNINSLRWESSVGTRTEDFTVFGTQFSYVLSIVTLLNNNK